MGPKAPEPAGSPDWWAARPAAPVGSRRGRPPADVARIVDVALKLVDDVGVHTFSLRMLAGALESGTATLYRHFASKDELMAYVVDRVLGEVDADGVESLDTWQEATAAVAQAFYQTLCRHPNVVPLLVAQVPVGPHGLAQRERVMRLMLAHGFSVDLAARAFTAIGHYVIGFAAQQHGPGSAGTDSAGQLREFYHRLDPVQYPAVTAAADSLTTVPLDEEFRFGLTLIINGLELERRPRVI